MTEFVFCGFSDYEDGKIARLETKETGIPINVYAEEGTDFSLTKGERCKVDIVAVGSNIKIYKNEEDYKKTGTPFAPISLIPTGTFPGSQCYKDFEENAYVLFSGKILEAEMNPEPDEDGPNCCALVETLEMSIRVYFRTSEPDKFGGIISGNAWLFGDIIKIVRL